MSDRKTRAIGYVRVSTDQQVDGYGLDAQEDVIKAHCRAAGMRLVTIERDEGESGSNGLDTRLGLARALAELQAGRADVLVVSRFDRLARDVIVQETVIRELKKSGRQVVSVAEPEGDADEATRQLVRVVLGAIGEYERILIRGRMLAGKAAKAHRGGYVGGAPRFGCRADDRELVTDEREQAVVARMAELHAAGHSLREIASTLDSEGHKPKRGDRWHAVTVSRVLARMDTPTRSKSRTTTP